jgi:hypothetical protein
MALTNSQREALKLLADAADRRADYAEPWLAASQR